MNRTMIRTTFLAALVALTLAPRLEAQASLPNRPPVEGVHFSARHDFRIDTVAEFERPWSIAWLPNGDMLVTERPGRLRIVRNGQLLPTPVAGTPKVFRDRGQGGLMDVLPHPDFATNRLVYLSYAKPSPDDSLGATAIVRGRLENDRLVDVQEVFVATNHWAPRNNHFAGKMAFDKSGYLFLTIGERQALVALGADHPAQDMANDYGAVIRIHDDGRIPADNPYASRADVPHEIWSKGHRNPQGLAVHPVTGDLWETEHGPRGGDELNLLLPGRNYGWPVVSHGVDYDGKPFTSETSRPGMEDPRWVWTPSIATSGLTFYDGDQFPWWKGSLFSGGLAGQVLARITLDGTEVRGVENMLVGTLGRIRDVKQGPDGYLYLAVDPEGSRGGTTPVVRLVPVQGDVLPPPR